MAYRLSFGIEGMDPIEGSESELFAMLDTYPDEVVIEVLALEKQQQSPFYPVLLSYVARRLVEGMEG